MYLKSYYKLQNLTIITFTGDCLKEKIRQISGELSISFRKKF